MIKYSLPLLLLFCLKLSYAQNAQQVITTKLARFEQRNPREKLFLHTDQVNYLAGEIMWFKATILIDSTNTKSGLSSVAYIEVLDGNQKPVLQTKLSINNGTGAGSLFLPASIASGSYKIRAYTNWMKNFDADGYFEKDITIINSLQGSIVDKPDKAKQYALQFFAEGGTLINGIDSRVAFKGVDQYGKGIDFTGTLLNENNNVVAQFKPFKFGIGSFEFKPEANHVYKAKIKLINGHEFTTAFIIASNQGYNMHVTGEAAGIVHIDVKTNIPNAGNIYLLAYTRKKNKAFQVAEVKDGHANFRVDQDKLGDGITYFTVFNSELQPVCERLHFKYPQQKLNFKLNATQQQYTSRQKVVLNIQANSNEGKAAAADLSVAVFNADSLTEDQSADIFSYLWLTSDLKGNIEQPQYYTRRHDAEVDEALDNLMLTQGWRKFKWSAVLQGRQPALNYDPEYELSIVSGKIINKQTNKPGVGIIANLAVLGNTTHLYGGKSDTAGRIAFYTKGIYGSVKLVVQTNRLQDSLYRIELDDPFSDRYSDHTFAEFKAVQKSDSYLLNHHIGMQVQNFYWAARLKRVIALNESTSPFYGDVLDNSYLLDKYTRFPTMQEVLSEYVAEVFIKKQGLHFQLTTYNVNDKRYMENSPLILLDGVPVTNPDQIIKYDPLKVKQLDIVAKDYYLGPLVFGGILNFSTYKKNLNGFELDPNALVIDYEGLQNQREFYAPVYDSPAATASRLPDFRNLLFWSPNVKTDASGAKQIDFYTSDRKGKYKVVVQGLADGGAAGSETTVFEVVK